jgi:hypothetical protein
MKTKTCESCSKPFELRVAICGTPRNLYTRRYCLVCSPFGTKDKRPPKDRLNSFRKCSRCKNMKPLTKDCFPTARRKFGPQFGYYCYECHSKRGTEHQRRRKQKCIDYKGGKCERCGYNKSINSLVFHHKIPTLKTFSIGTRKTRNWETVKAELDKCNLICANCHGEIHEQENLHRAKQNTNTLNSLAQ